MNQPDFSSMFQQTRDLITKSMGGLNEKLTSYDDKLTKMQKQVDAIDLNSQSQNRLIGAVSHETLVDRLKSIDSFQHLITARRGRAVLTFSGVDSAGAQLRSASDTTTFIGEELSKIG